MNALEKRLADTEKALFFALQELHDGAASQVDYRSQNSYQPMRESVLSNDTPTTQQDKAKLVASWASRPLETRTQARAWLESMRTGACATDIAHHQQATPTSLRSTAAQIAAPERSLLLRTDSESEMLGDNAPLDGAMLLAQRQPSSLGASQRRETKRPRDEETRQNESLRSRQIGGAAHLSAHAPEPSGAKRFANANKNMYF